MEKSFLNSKIYKVLHAFVNVGLWISIVMSVIYLILLLFIPDFLTGSNSNLSFDGFILTNDILGKKTESYYLLSFANVVAMGVGILCLWMIRDIINSLRSNSPFISKNVKRIRVIGWTLFADTYLSQLISYSFADKLYHFYVQKGIEPLIKARFTIIPNGAILALIIILLAEIFKFGCTLQQEHDTTV
ncbi:MAG: DUF2975 domain-containing protein [Bacillota bacterium]|nr:DUF2975 domain-containing protein [Bacillota bacterium]